MRPHDDRRGQVLGGQRRRTGAFIAHVTKVEAQFTYVSVSAGDDHTCGLTSTGVVECWGRTNRGQATPKSLSSGSFVSVSAGNQYTCGVPSTGKLECWARAAAVNQDLTLF